MAMRSGSDDRGTGWGAVGAGAAAAVPLTMLEALSGYQTDQALAKHRMPYKDLLAAMQPGDMMLSSIAKDAPYKKAIQTATGATWYHPSLYTGRGHKQESLMPTYRGSRTNWDVADENLVLRPKVKPSEVKAALATSADMMGTPYISRSEFAKDGLLKLLGIPQGKGGQCEGINCQRAVSKWYPKLAPDQGFNPRDAINDAAGAGKDWEVVGRLSKTKKLPLSSQFYSRLAHPALKWGLLAGLPAAAAYSALNSEEEQA